MDATVKAMAGSRFMAAATAAPFFEVFLQFVHEARFRGGNWIGRFLIRGMLVGVVAGFDAEDLANMVDFAP
jgi:hypothetical protein